MNEKVIENCKFARKRLFHAYKWIEKNFLKLSLEDRKKCKEKLKEIQKDLDAAFDQVTCEEEWRAGMGLPLEKKTFNFPVKMKIG